MRKLSRWRPAARNVIHVPVWFIPSFVILGIILLGLFAPIQYALTLSAFVLLGYLGSVVMNHRLRRQAEGRQGEDIGTFARSFNRRDEPFDPWVVRATWDALQPYVTFRGGSLPLRASDRLDKLPIDPEDLENEVIEEVAERSGHVHEPLAFQHARSSIKTVGDFVKFISSQPRVDARS